jgi:polygalacturonase
VTLTVKPGQKLVINVDRLRKLFVFAELRERNLTAMEQAGVVNIVECGADPTGRADSTTTIQAAINSLPADGVLYFPPGLYRSGSLQLKSDMTLHLAGGALLKGSDDHRRFQHYRDGSYLYFLLVDGLENVRITGRGTIDGNGYVVRRKWQDAKGLRKQPGRLLLCVDSRRIEISDVALRDSYSWTAHLVDCRDCRLKNVKLLADTRLSNGDGLDVDGCRRIRADDLFIYAEDDAISIKAAWCREDPEDLVFRKCVLWSQNATGVRIGTETRSEAFRRLRFEDLSILRANTMIRVFCSDGADIQDVVFRNIDTEEITMHVPPGFDEYHRIRELSKGVTYLFQLQVRKRGNADLGNIHNILFENINARVTAGSKIKGYDAPEGTILIRDVTFRDLRMEHQLIRDPKAGRFDINTHVEGVRFETTARDR